MPRQKAVLGRNSHHGCLQCKRRGVKCDEKRPSCTKCESRLDACRYGGSGPWLWKDPAVPIRHSTAYKTASSRSNPSMITNRGTDVVPGPIISAVSSGGLDQLHLKLLRNWTTATALTISRNDSDRRIWQTIVLRQALNNPYLLHGVFSISAIHLALNVHTQSDEREELIRTAEHHQSEAIQLFTNNSEEKSQAQQMERFVLSCLLIGFAFAFPLAFSAQAQELSDPLEEMLQIIRLIKSTMDFSAPILTGVKSDEIHHLTYVSEDSSGSSTHSCPAISTLHELNANRIQDCKQHEAFHQAINQLEDLFNKINSGAEPVSSIFTWLFEIPTQFYCLLQERHPLALIIFAHYCVTLHQLRKLWWISSWGHRVLEVINKTLSPEWKPFMEWVLHTTGLVATALEASEYSSVVQA